MKPATSRLHRGRFAAAVTALAVLLGGFAGATAAQAVEPVPADGTNAVVVWPNASIRAETKISAPSVGTLVPGGRVTAGPIVTVAGWDWRPVSTADGVSGFAEADALVDAPAVAVTELTSYAVAAPAVASGGIWGALGEGTKSLYAAPFAGSGSTPVRRLVDGEVFATSPSITVTASVGVTGDGLWRPVLVSGAVLWAPDAQLTVLSSALTGELVLESNAPLFAAPTGSEPTKQLKAGTKLQVGEPVAGWLFSNRGWFKSADVFGSAGIKLDDAVMNKEAVLAEELQLYSETDLSAKTATVPAETTILAGEEFETASGSWVVVELLTDSAELKTGTRHFALKSDLPGAWDAIKDGAGTAKDKVADAATAAKDKLADTASGAKESVSFWSLAWLLPTVLASLALLAALISAAGGRVRGFRMLSPRAWVTAALMPVSVILALIAAATAPAAPAWLPWLVLASAVCAATAAFRVVGGYMAGLGTALAGWGQRGVVAAAVVVSVGAVALLGGQSVVAYLAAVVIALGAGFGFSTRGTRDTDATAAAAAAAHEHVVIPPAVAVTTTDGSL